MQKKNTWAHFCFDFSLYPRAKRRKEMNVEGTSCICKSFGLKP